MRLALALLTLLTAGVAAPAIAADAPAYERRVYREAPPPERRRVERRVVVEEREPDEYVIVRRRYLEQGFETRYQERVFTRPGPDDVYEDGYAWDSKDLAPSDW